MAILFRSSKDIVKSTEFLFSKLTVEYWAHINGRKPSESLFEHSRLVANYLDKLIEAHGLEPVVNATIEKLCRSLKLESLETTANLVKEIFINSIFLHDLGKVNPNFQANVMKNRAFENKPLEIKNHHSFPGAVIFSNYYFRLISDLPNVDDRTKNLLYFITISFSNSIIRHHSSYIDFTKDFSCKKNELSECFALLDTYGIQMAEEVSSSFFTHYNLLEKQFIEESSENSRLLIYVLIKLSFSLLTASDFYATNEFMADIIVSNFGLIDNGLKRRVKESFWSEKKYNKELFHNLDICEMKSFDDLQERNPTNLNFLRQKLTAEVISTLRKNPDNFWYYIEAPTGAGKTNLSLACVVELLQKHPTINKVFYVFPFTTLITQTFEAIKETIKLTNEELIQLHSKTGLHTKTQNGELDAKYGDERTLYLDHLFINYPFTIISHVKFFEIIKGNDKEANYVFHRLCNSIVIIDELHSYNPKHWDKMIFFIEHYAQLLNMRFIIMSATLPKIDEMSKTARGKFVSLTPNKDQYFKNPNFLGRVEFDFSLINELKVFKDKKDDYLSKLADKIKKEAELYASSNKDNVRVLVEFITKNTASKFFNNISKNSAFSGYKIYIISGDILESRRREVIKKIKTGADKKVVLVSTQVVEAGVDIDMDIGFKDRALLDSDEQFAGRINRNASKNGCKVFLFEFDSIKTIYGRDERYKHQTKNEYFEKKWQEILVQKKFHELYSKVFEERLKPDWTDENKFPAYMENFKRFDFQSINSDFRLIDDNESQIIFIPLEIDIPEEFANSEILCQFKVLTSQNKISGKLVFQRLIEILTRKTENIDFLKSKIDLKKIAGLISLFTINIHPQVVRKLNAYFDPEMEKYGFKYLKNLNIYTYENGFDMSKTAEDIFL